MSELRWDHFRTLLAIARAGTLSGAGRRLGIDQTTAARQLAAMEERAGAALFDRASGMLRPNALGQRLIDHAAGMEREAEAARRAVRAANDPDREAPAGTVRLTAVAFLIHHWIVPALPDFAERYPRVTLALLPESRNLSFSRRETDLALRLGRPEGEAGPITRRVGQIGFSVCGPAEPGPLPLPWIGYDAGARHLPQAEWIAAQSGGPPAPLQVADVETAQAAVRAGLGRTLLPAALAADDPAIRVESEGPVLGREVWLMVQPDLRRTPAVQVVRDWLTGLFPERSPP